MFIYSIKGSTIRFFGILTLAFLALVLLVVLVPSYGEDVVASGQEINYSGIRDHAARAQFLSQFGWTVENTPDLMEKVTIPAEFDNVFVGYNELQKSQGLDLSRYRRKEVEHFRYVVTNYPNTQGKVFVNLLIYRGRVIGGDITSSAGGGFVYGFSGKPAGASSSAPTTTNVPTPLTSAHPTPTPSPAA